MNSNRASRVRSAVKSLGLKGSKIRSVEFSSSKESRKSGQKDFLVWKYDCVGPAKIRPPKK